MFIFFLKRYFKWCLSLIVIFNLAACSHNGSSIKYQVNDFLIASNAIDSTLEKAREKALSNLSQQIFVEVKSSFSSKEKLVNEDYTSTSNNNIALFSQGFFQGVVFFNENKVSSKSYEVSVGLTEDSVLDTINLLSDSLINNSNKIDFVTKLDLKEDLQKANFLLSLYSYAKVKNLKVAVSNENYQKIIAYQQALDAKVKAVAQVRFLIYPNDNKAIIKIGNKKYNPFANIYLGAEKYFYEVALEGYKTEKGVLNLSKGSNFQVKVFLQKLLNKPFLIKLEVSQDKYRNLVKSILYDNQMQIHNDSYNSIKVSFGNISSSKVINNYYNIILPVTMDFYRNNILINTFQVEVRYLSPKNVTEIPENIVKEQLIENSKEFFSTIYD